MVCLQVEEGHVFKVSNKRNVPLPTLSRVCTKKNYILCALYFFYSRKLSKKRRSRHELFHEPVYRQRHRSVTDLLLQNFSHKVKFPTTNLYKDVEKVKLLGCFRKDQFSTLRIECSYCKWISNCFLERFFDPIFILIVLLYSIQSF